LLGGELKIHASSLLGFGGGLAGAIYDYAGFYAIAFATGIAFNLVYLALIGSLVRASACARRRPGLRG
jgi:hypothetical protein